MKCSLMIALLWLPAVLASPTTSNGSPSLLQGNWLGRSLCVTARPACADETVQYRVQYQEKTQAFTIAADKLVAGQYELMGELTCSFEPLRQLLRCPMNDDYWLFRWDGDTLIGTLMMKEAGPFRVIQVHRSNQTKSD